MGITLMLDPSLDVWYGEIEYEYEYEDEDRNNFIYKKTHLVKAKGKRKKIRLVIPNPA